MEVRGTSAELSAPPDETLCAEEPPPLPPPAYSPDDMDEAENIARSEPAAEVETVIVDLPENKPEAPPRAILFVEVFAGQGSLSDKVKELGIDVMKL